MLKKHLSDSKNKFCKELVTLVVHKNLCPNLLFNVILETSRHNKLRLSGGQPVPVHQFPHTSPRYVMNVYRLFFISISYFGDMSNQTLNSTSQ